MVQLRSVTNIPQAYRRLKTICTYLPGNKGLPHFVIPDN